MLVREQAPPWFRSWNLAALWRRVGPSLRVPIAVYVAAILAMGISALTTSYAWVIGGAVLFMASDGLLATERFLLAAENAAGGASENKPIHSTSTRRRASAATSGSTLLMAMPVANSKPAAISRRGKISMCHTKSGSSV